MRFTLIKDLKEDSSMGPILSGLLLFTLLYLVADVFVLKGSFGLFFAQIQNTLYGNMDEYIDPMSNSLFLEFIHSQIFFMMMILLTLSAVFIRLFSKTRFSLVLVNLLMFSALCSLVMLALSYYVSQEFIVAYIITFFIWHVLAFVMSALSLWSLNFAKSL